ncbi:MAG: BMP family ABC transporter substrate-binding protein, partial [Vitreoscilla sp.]
MTTSTRRSVLRGTALGSIALAAALAGCSKKDEAAPAAPSASAAAAPASAASGPLKVAFVYIGPVGDHGWSFAHDNGRKALEKELGAQVQTTAVEKVPESADAERVFRDMAAQGNTLIFGTSFGYMEPMVKAAADNKGV